MQKKISLLTILINLLFQIKDSKFNIHRKTDQPQQMVLVRKVERKN